MIIAATSDIHSPQYYNDFVRALDRITKKPDLFLFAGDMIDRGVIEEFDKIRNAMFGKINAPVVACFGNNEYQEIRVSVQKRFGDIKFLDDEATVLDISGK